MCERRLSDLCVKMYRFLKRLSLDKTWAEKQETDPQIHLEAMTKFPYRF